MTDNYAEPGPTTGRQSATDPQTPERWARLIDKVAKESARADAAEALVAAAHAQTATVCPMCGRAWFPVAEGEACPFCGLAEAVTAMIEAVGLIDRDRDDEASVRLHGVVCVAAESECDRLRGTCDGLVAGAGVLRTMLAAAERDRDLAREDADAAEARLDAADQQVQDWAEANAALRRESLALTAKLDAAREAWVRRIAAPWATNAGGVILDAVTTNNLALALAAPDAPAPEPVAVEGGACPACDGAGWLDTCPACCGTGEEYALPPRCIRTPVVRADATVPEPVRPDLVAAVTALYNAAHWTADRPVDADALWAAVRDAAGIAPGHSPAPSAGTATRDNPPDMEARLVALATNEGRRVRVSVEPSGESEACFVDKVGGYGFQSAPSPSAAVAALWAQVKGEVQP